MGATLYLHLDAEDLRRHTQDGDLTPGTVEKLGSASLDLIATWLGRTSGMTIKPVLDMNRSDAVDAHDPPAWMRDLVILRDGHCVFPGCNVDARRCDQDHTSPTSRSTRVDHPARPVQRISPACVDDTTG